jgi:hypothetical protein
MHAHGGIDLGIPFGQRYGSPTALQIIARVDDKLYTCLPSPPYDCIAIEVELGEIEVAV